MLGRKFDFPISYIDLFSINITDKTILSISNIENLSIPNIDRKVFNIRYGQIYFCLYCIWTIFQHITYKKFLYPIWKKGVLFIWHVDNLATCGKEKTIMSIIGKEKMSFSILCMDNLSIYNIDNVFVCIMYSQIIFIQYRQILYFLYLV